MNGPFNSVIGGNTIGSFVKNELFPVTKSIRELAIEVSKFRAGFTESFFRKKIRELDSRYRSLSVDLISLYNKWETPDELFKEINLDKDNPQIMGPILMDYFNSQQAVMQHFNESFRLLSYIDDILTTQSTASFTRMSVGISLLAIVTSIIVGIIKLN